MIPPDQEPDPEKAAPPPPPLEPPTPAARTVVRCLVRGEHAENALGYALVAAVALTLAAFGPLMPSLLFWLSAAVALSELSLKLLVLPTRRPSPGPFSSVKCADVPSQWDAFRSLRSSLRTRPLALLAQLGIYATLWIALWVPLPGKDQPLLRKQDDRATQRMHELLQGICCLSILHWAAGLWVLVWGLALWTISGLTPLLLIPSLGTTRGFVGSAAATCLECLCWSSCLPCFAWCVARARHGTSGPPNFWFWLESAGRYPGWIEPSLSSLTWYVHCRRHPQLSGFAAHKAEDCGLDVHWTMKLSEVIDLVRGNGLERTSRVSPLAQKWVVDEVKRELCEKEHGHEEQESRHHTCTDGLDGLHLLEAMLRMLEGAEEGGEGAGPKEGALEVVDRLFASGMVSESLEAAVSSPEVAVAGRGFSFTKGARVHVRGGAMRQVATRLVAVGDGLSERDRWSDAREVYEAALKLQEVFEGEEKDVAGARERLSVTLSMLGHEMSDVGRWGEARELHQSALKLCSRFQAERTQLAGRHNDVAWAMAHMHPITAQELKVAEQHARIAVSFAEEGGRGGGGGNLMRVRLEAGCLDTLAYVLWKMGNLDEALAAQQRAVKLCPEQEELHVHLQILMAEIDHKRKFPPGPETGRERKYSVGGEGPLIVDMSPEPYSR